MFPTRRLLLSLPLLLSLGVGGCTSTESTVGDPAPATARLGSSSGSKTMLVEVVSDPGDGMVVLNRQPVGLAPQMIELPVTDQGFMADPITIAVRFVARNVEEASMTSSITLHPTDRAPLRLEFERENVKRVLR